MGHSRIQSWDYKLYANWKTRKPKHFIQKYIRYEEDLNPEEKIRDLKKYSATHNNPCHGKRSNL